MSADDWERAEALFHEALHYGPEQRAAFLEGACGSNQALRQVVEALLRADDEPAPLFAVPRESIAAMLTPQEDADFSGTQVGPYHIEVCIGRGSMGVVYRARDTRLHRAVALKFLPPYLSADERAKERFLIEAQAASALDHPNICTIHDIGQTDTGYLYIAMAHYEGQTLKARLAEGTLPVMLAVKIALGIAEGLSAAHAQGIIHRDVKPGNVLLVEDASEADLQVKLLDFGLAKMDGTDLTRSGTTLGTIAYMSPEQAEGLEVDHRADLWALGAVLYEMLAGTRPFQGSHPAVVLHGILHREPVPVHTRRPEIPSALARIVERALAKPLEARYQNAREVRAALLALLPGFGKASLLPALEEGGGSRLNRLFSVLAGAGQRRFWRRERAVWSTRRGLAKKSRRPILYLTVLAVIGALLIVMRLSVGRAKPPEVISSVAVLPFANISNDPDDAYISDGLTEELLSALGKTAGLRVPARTSVFAMQKQQASLREIGKALGVRHVLEGSVRRADSTLRIRATLSDVATGLQLWTETYEREIDDLFAVQEAIARQIVEHLRARLAPREIAVLPERPAPHPDAYALYLKGRYFWNKRTVPLIEKSRLLFQEAISIDSLYAPAWAGLADAYVMLASYGALPPSVAYPEARAAATNALALDSTLAETHTVLGLINKDYYWDWQAASHHFRRAVELDSTYATGMHQYAVEYLSVMGRHEEAIHYAERAAALAPLSLIINADLGRVYDAARQPDRAIRQLEKTLELDPDFFMARLYLGISYLQKRQPERALAAFRQAAAVSGDSLGPNPNTLAYMAIALAESGRTAEARRVLAEIQAMAERRYVPPYWQALIYMSLGDKDRAFAWLDSAYADRNLHLIYLKDAPFTASFREDPRGRALLQKMNLLEGGRRD